MRSAPAAHARGASRHVEAPKLHAGWGGTQPARDERLREEPCNGYPSLLAMLKARGSELSTLTTRHATLEDVFVSLTGRHLQEEEPAK